MQDRVWEGIRYHEQIAATHTLCILRKDDESEDGGLADRRLFMSFVTRQDMRGLGRRACNVL